MPAFVPKTLAAMRQLIDSYIVNNTSNSISPSQIRAIFQTLLDFCCSYFGNQEVQVLDGSSGAVTWDVQEGANATLLLTEASTTLSISNLNDGQYCTVVLTQEDGANELVFDEPEMYHVVNNGGGAVDFSGAAAGQIDCISFFRVSEGIVLVMYGSNFTSA